MSKHRLYVAICAYLVLAGFMVYTLWLTNVQTAALHQEDLYQLMLIHQDIQNTQEATLIQCQRSAKNSEAFRVMNAEMEKIDNSYMDRGRGDQLLPVQAARLEARVKAFQKYRAAVSPISKSCLQLLHLKESP